MTDSVKDKPNTTKEVVKDEAPKKKATALSREAFTEIIKNVVTDVVKEQVNTAVAPLKEQNTTWMESLQKTQEEAKRYVRPTDPKKLGIGAARYVRALAAGRGDIGRAKFFAEKAWSDSLGDTIVKDLSAGNLAAGGFLVPAEFSNELIELLRSRAVVRAAGPRIVPLNNGTLTLPRQTAAASASYIGEAKDIPTSEPAGGQLTLTAKKLAALVPISNDLLLYDQGGNAADVFVRDDLVKTIAIREDQAFLRDDGTQDKPKGLLNWAVAANVSASNGTTSDNIETDFKDLINDLEGSNVPMIRPVWFMHPRSKNHLRNLRDANGNLIFEEIRSPTPTLYGWPVFVTTHIPINLGGGTETEIFFVDMSEVIIGEASGLEIAVDSSASFTSGASLVSSFERDETLIRAIARHDLVVRHPESVAIKNTVTWGA